jgi:hypothetical protein
VTLSSTCCCCCCAPHLHTSLFCTTAGLRN